MKKTKPFCISRQTVWEAYQRIKANKGGAGIDQIEIKEFEKDVKANLYRLWNRMSSGSYMPPPVLLVEIPKKDGNKRPLGIPTVISHQHGLFRNFDDKGVNCDQKLTTAKQYLALNDNLLLCVCNFCLHKSGLATKSRTNI